ncbi:MAG: hypothetical protein ACYDCL_01390 [Myxococcales bacterium]
MRRSLAIASLCALAAAGCNKAKDEANNAIGSAIINHELAKHGEHVDMGAMQDAQKQMKALAEAPKRPVVSFQKLLPLLPEPPAGWTAEKADGNTMNTPQMQTTNVHRMYRSKQGNASMNLVITDGMSPIYAGIGMLAAISEESTTGYRKPFNYAGGVGTEQWNSQNKNGGILLVTKNHFLIQVDAENATGLQPAKDLIATLDPTKVDATAQ